MPDAQGTANLASWPRTGRNGKDRTRMNWTNVDTMLMLSGFLTGWLAWMVRRRMRVTKDAARRDGMETGWNTIPIVSMTFNRRTGELKDAVKCSKCGMPIYPVDKHGFVGLKPICWRCIYHPHPNDWLGPSHAERYETGIDMGAPGSKDVHVTHRFRGATDGADEVARERYVMLINAVARKFPGESRFETALRYIREAEASASQPCPAVQAKPGQSGSARTSLLACLATAMLATLAGIALALPFWKIGALAFALAVLAGLLLDGRDGRRE